MPRKTATESEKNPPPVETDDLVLDADAEVDDVAEVEEVEEDVVEEEVIVEADHEASPEVEKKAPRAPSHAAMGKAPPPPKDWRIQGISPEGLTVTLGRYITKAEADPDFNRLITDGFYRHLKIITPGGKVEQESGAKESKKK